MDTGERRMTAEMISIDHVTKRYGRITGLQDVSFTVKRGMITGLLGRNGAGKTTALNLMTGYFPPDEGQVFVNGMSMLQRPGECRRMIGYLPEKPPLYDEMTVTDYLRFVCDLKEVAGKDRNRHVEEILHICALDEMRSRVIGHLSKGFRQRAGIAQALCGNPEILILDEPTVGLDPLQVVEIRELIRNLGQDHTILFSSHILSEVQQLCSMAVILHEGRLIRSFDMTAEETRDVIRIRISILGKKSELLQAIQSIGCVLRTEIMVSGDPEVTVLRLTGKTKDDRGLLTDQLFHLLAALDAPIRQLVTEKNELEDVFLQATAD